MPGQRLRPMCGKVPTLSPVTSDSTCTSYHKCSIILQLFILQKTLTIKVLKFCSIKFNKQIKLGLGNKMMWFRLENTNVNSYNGYSTSGADIVACH